MKRDFISFSPFSTAELNEVITLSHWLKEDRPADFRPLEGKTAALIFEKPSLRTRVSFEVGIRQLGGECTFLTQEHIGVSTRESVRDIAEVLSRYCDLIIARTMKHETVEFLSTYATVPVINALTDYLHPCQILADAFTLIERGLFLKGNKITFIGDGNNVVNSWLELMEKYPLTFTLACPEGYEPDAALVARAQKNGLSEIKITHNPAEAAEDASVLYTDVWVSMGDESQSDKRRRDFRNYQINSQLLALAQPDCVVMHCLPAHRGEEISAEVLEGRQSVVLDQAENRLHIQKGIIAFLVEKQSTIRLEPTPFAESTLVYP